MTSKPSTRSETVCVLLGSPSEFSATALPTVGDVLRLYLFHQHQLKSQCKQDPSVSVIAEYVTKKVEEMWEKSSIPVVSHQRIIQKIRDHHNKYQKTLKRITGKHRSNSFENIVSEFKKQCESQLFDIASCKCTDFGQCGCEKQKKVPAAERTFLADQRTVRKMYIGSVDVVETKKIQLREFRKRKSTEILKQYMTSETAELSSNTASSTDMGTSSEEQGDYDFQNVASTATSAKSNPRQLELTTVARECDRYGVSDRCAAAIASAALHDIAAANEGNTAFVTDRNKIRRERKKLRQHLSAENVPVLLTALFFDGRKDSTRGEVSKAGKMHPTMLTEDHYTLVAEPDSKYIGHITVENGESATIQKTMFQYFKERDIALQEVTAIGCDSTNVNTGVHKGVIRLCELQLGRPLQWLICLLHTNELPLRHLFHTVDGPTHGPRAFSGPIGKALMGCEKLPVVRFIAIPQHGLPVMQMASVKSLSNDQRYLYEICQAVSSGTIKPDLANKTPGPVVHSRWLTTANRLLRLYVATEHPSTNLVTLCKYVMNVYAPLWFSIKMNSHCSDGSRHLCSLIVLSRYLSADLLVVVDEVIQRNAFFAHIENVLVAMLNDERNHIRELAYRRIIAARQRNTDDRVRKFVIPKVNLNATNYIDLIDWSSEEKWEPPLTKHMSLEELQHVVANGFKVPAAKIPCHSQGTERCVRLVTEASEAAVGHKQRHGFILAKLKSREAIPKFNTKSDFSV